MMRVYLFLALIFLSSVVASQSNSTMSGTFLASRFSSSVNDYNKSAIYTVSMIEKGNKQPEIYNDALLFLIAAGKFEKAFLLADTMEKMNLRSPALGLILIVKSLKEEKYDLAIKLFSKFAVHLPSILKISIQGWIHVENGDLEAAEREFDAFRNSDLNIDLSFYYKAIAYAQVGDYAKASKLIRENSKNSGLLGVTYEIFKANVASLAHSPSIGTSILDQTMKENPDQLTLKQLHKKISEGKSNNLEVFKTTLEGIGDTLLLFAEGDNQRGKYNLIETFYCQLAKYISNNAPRFNIRLAKSLSKVKLFDEAIISLNLVKFSDIFYAEAKVMLAEVLANSSQETLAVNELKNLIEMGVKNFEVYEALGNVYRYAEQFDLADEAYSEALRLKKKLDLEDQNLWLIYFFRGIAREQLKEYKDSIADLRRSLELRPAQPQVLNYLGYMLIERKENLDEALDMIELAVEKSPQSGYIIDSLAWGLYQLGRYEEAITPMEKAISLEPEDPIVNDHFGDVLWKVGRKREAYFQWKRVLLFQPSEELRMDVEKKLKQGLEDF